MQQHPLLIDVRTPEEFSQGSVPGAINIPLDELLTQLTSLKDKGPTTVFCEAGGRAGRAKMILENAGIKDVTNGGGWRDLI